MRRTWNADNSGIRTALAAIQPLHIETPLENPNKTRDPIAHYSGVGVALGAAFGMVFGAAFDDAGAGLALGAGIGVAIGAGIGTSKKKKQP